MDEGGLGARSRPSQQTTIGEEGFVFVRLLVFNGVFARCHCGGWWAGVVLQGGGRRVRVLRVN